MERNSKERITRMGKGGNVTEDGTNVNVEYLKVRGGCYWDSSQFLQRST